MKPSILFTPTVLGGLQIKNRFVHSACEDNLAGEGGRVSQAMIKRYGLLAQGEIGLIVTGHLYVHPLGQGNFRQAGIHDEAGISGLGRLAAEVHRHDGRIVFQIGHGGLQASRELIGRQPYGPDNMDGDDFETFIEAFARAAQRAVEAGADGVQLHGAHGYLLNETLSPYYNHRQDSWGGDPAGRFRFIREVVTRINDVRPKGFLLLVKLNTNDFSPSPGIDFHLASQYASWLRELGVDGLETSCGGSRVAPWAMCRGHVPVAELIRNLSADKKDKAEEILRSQAGNFDLEGPYNLEAASYIKSRVPGWPVYSVGGWREVQRMELAVENKETDLIAMCRPFIREPFLVKKIREGRSLAAGCQNCNRCLAGLRNKLPLQCYYTGLPDHPRP